MQLRSPLHDASATCSLSPSLSVHQCLADSDASAGVSHWHLSSQMAIYPCFWRGFATQPPSSKLCPCRDRNKLPVTQRNLHAVKRCHYSCSHIQLIHTHKHSRQQLHGSREPHHNCRSSDTWKNMEKINFMMLRLKLDASILDCASLQPHFNHVFIHFLCTNYSQTQHGHTWHTHPLIPDKKTNHCFVFLL